MYVAFALAFGLVSAGVTMLTKSALPSATTPENADEKAVAGKTMYMAAGSGIPEIKTILGGFVIPDFLSLKVLVVKAVGAVFAVSTGMCLGKEGKYIHRTCYQWIELTLNLNQVHSYIFPPAWATSSPISFPNTAIMDAR